MSQVNKTVAQSKSTFGVDLPTVLFTCRSSRQGFPAELQCTRYHTSGTHILDVRIGACYILDMSDKRTLINATSTIPKGVVFIAIAAFVTILVAGYWFYNEQRRIVKVAAEAHLTAIADLKVQQITQWREEQLSDANVLGKSPFFSQACREWLANPQTNSDTNIHSLLKLFQHNHGYEDVFLADTNGLPRISVSSHMSELSDAEKVAVASVLSDHQPILTDIYLHGSTCLVSVVGIVCGVENTSEGVAGVIVFRIDVSKSLCRLVQAWPIPSKSAETLLVRKDGDSVLFLNELRHRTDTAMKLRIPLTDTDTPAVAAANGRTGVMHGSDYRGVTVVSVLKKIPDTSWYMVAKVDREEVLAVWRMRSTLIAAMIIGFLLCLGGIVATAWQRNIKIHFITMLKAEMARREGEAKYFTTLMSVGDGVIVTDNKGKVEFLNKVAEDLTGWVTKDAIGRDLLEVFNIINEYTRKLVENPVDKVLKEKRIVGLANHTLLIARDGRERPIADSGSPICGEDGKIIGVVLVFRDQTKERGAEVVLARKQSEVKALADRQHVLLSAIPDIVMEVNADKVYTWANQAGLDFFGEDCIGKEANFYFEGEQETYPIVQQLFLGDDRMFHVESWQRRKDGQKRLLSWSCRVLKDCDGNVLGALSSARDITERIRMEQEIKDGLDRFTALYDNMAEGMALHELVYDNNGKLANYRIVDVNKQYESILGVKRETIIGKLGTEVYGTEEPPYLAQFSAPAIDGKPVMFETYFPPMDRYFSISVCAWMGKKGFATIFTDVTGRKRVEQAVAEERERLDVTLRSIGDAVMCTDIGGKVTLLNPVAEQLTGWDQAEAVGQPVQKVFNIVNEYTNEPCENPVDKALKSGEIVHLANHTKLIARDGRMMSIADSGAPIRDAQGKIIGIVLVFRDTTEHRRLQESIQRASKMESVGLLAGGIAHDFNNLLAGVFGYLDVAQESLRERQLDETADALSKAMSVFDRVKALTHQLLTFSKGGAPVRRHVDIAAVVEKSARFSLSGSTVTCRFEHVGAIWACNCDEGQMSQVIGNMIINSQQAMPSGGSITVTIRNLGRAEPKLVLLNAEEDYVKISIKDTGVGIPASILSNIFDPFFTTKTKGHGLGLATCFSIIKQHEGVIDVESEPGKGTTFHIYLPALPTAELSGESSNNLPTVKGSGTVLVMDDEDYIRHTLSKMLKRIGYEALTVVEGAAAVAEIKKAKAGGVEFAAVILDLTIPGGMGGAEAIKAIRAIDETIPAIAVSGYSEDPVVASPKEHGFDVSLKKPYTKAQLAQVLSDVGRKSS